MGRRSAVLAHPVPDRAGGAHRARGLRRPAKRDESIRGDQLFYNSESDRLADGDGFVEPFDPQALIRGQVRKGHDPAADHPPLTVIVLTPVAFLTDHDEIAKRLTMSLLGAVAVGVIGLLARQLAGDRAAGSQRALPPSTRTCG